jgi:hypothetical protein
MDGNNMDHAHALTLTGWGTDYLRVDSETDESVTHQHAIMRRTKFRRFDVQERVDLWTIQHSRGVGTISEGTQGGHHAPSETFDR